MLKISPQSVAIHCAYYLGEFTGSKVCLLVTVARGSSLLCQSVVDETVQRK